MKVSFGKGVTIITIASMWAIIPLVFVTESWPSKWFVICWTVFWVAFEVCNIQIKKYKKKKQAEKHTNLMTEVANLIKDSNVDNDDILKILKQIKNIID